MRPPRKWQRGIGHTQTRWDPPDKEWLEHHYNTLQKSARQIAREIGADSHVVGEWLCVAAIRTRTQIEGTIVAKRALRGSKNPSWRGGGSWYWHEQARTTLQEAGIPRVCVLCDITATNAWIEVHHKDEDIRNNALENLQYLCRPCHSMIHHDLRDKE